MTLGFRLDMARIRIFGSPTEGGITWGKELIFNPHFYALVGVKKHTGHLHRICVN